MDELTPQDYELLCEALEAWEEKDSFDEVMSDLMGAMLARTDEQRTLVEFEQAKRRAEAEQKKRLRKERSVILRAKLLSLRDSLTAETMTTVTR